MKHMHKRTTRTTAAAAAAVAAISCGWTLVSAQQAPAPTFKSGVELVSIDVGVLDRQGHPMRGLSAGDFTITVAGQPRKVVSAEYVNSGDAAAPANLKMPPSLISTNEGA